jgi:uncharacterized protein YciI
MRRRAPFARSAATRAAKWPSPAMRWFILIGHDGPRGRELRAVHRPAHLAGLEPLANAGRIRHAGPMLGDDGTPIGSVVLFQAEDLSDARAIAERDPYVTEGIFARYEVRETTVVFPKS